MTEKTKNENEKRSGSKAELIKYWVCVTFGFDLFSGFLVIVSGTEDAPPQPPPRADQKTKTRAEASPRFQKVSETNQDASSSRTMDMSLRVAALR